MYEVDTSRSSSSRQFSAITNSSESLTIPGLVFSQVETLLQCSDQRHLLTHFPFLIDNLFAVRDRWSAGPGDEYTEEDISVLEPVFLTRTSGSLPLECPGQTSPGSLRYDLRWVIFLLNSTGSLTGPASLVMLTPWGGRYGVSRSGNCLGGSSCLQTTWCMYLTMKDSQAELRDRAGRGWIPFSP